MKQQFSQKQAGEIAHEVMNPMCSVLQLVEKINQGETLDHAQCERLLRSTKRVIHYVDELRQKSHNLELTNEAQEKLYERIQTKFPHLSPREVGKLVVNIMLDCLADRAA